MSIFNVSDKKYKKFKTSKDFVILNDIIIIRKYNNI